MLSPKLTVEQKAALAARLAETQRQSSSIRDHIEFIRDNANLPGFAGPVATPAELLAMIEASKHEFVDFAKHHVPIYLGCCLIEEFNAHWSVEEKPSMAMFGQPYVDGFGNIEYENVYLPRLRLEDHRDVQRFHRIRASCRRASELLARFTETFSSLSGSSILRSELEDQCIDVLPRGREAEHVWRSRVTKYAKLLKIRVKRG